MREEGTTDKEIISEEKLDDEHLLHCRVPDDLFYLRGHFTGFPLVPGVCQLKWARDFISELTGETVSVEKIVSLKFHSFLQPGGTFTIGAKKVKGAWRYRLFDGDRKYASGKLTTR